MVVVGRGGGGKVRRGAEVEGGLGERGADGGVVGDERYIGSKPALRSRKVNGIIQLSGWNLFGLLLLLLLPAKAQAVELDQHDKVFPPSEGALCSLDICSCKPSFSQPALLDVSCAVLEHRQELFSSYH